MPLDYVTPIRPDRSGWHFRWDRVALAWSILASPPLALIPTLAVMGICERYWPAFDKQVGLICFFGLPFGVFLFCWRIVFHPRWPGRTTSETLFAAYLISGMSSFVAGLVLIANWS